MWRESTQPTPWRYRDNACYAESQKLMPHILYGDCFAHMRSLPAHSVHAVFADLPYGITQNAWDTPIDLQAFWEECWRILPPNGPVICNAAQPFTSALVMSQVKYFRHEWVWQKTAATGHLNAKHQPMRAHESIIVFCRKKSPYYPQKTSKHTPVHSYTKHTSDGKNYGKTKLGIQGGGSTDRYPLSVQTFSSDKQKSALHQTQKPLALMWYLVRTYTTVGQTILDPACGSGTAIVAALLECRQAIGIESDPDICRVAQERVVQQQEMLKRAKHDEKE